METGIMKMVDIDVLSESIVGMTFSRAVRALKMRETGFSSG